MLIKGSLRRAIYAAQYPLNDKDICCRSRDDHGYSCTRMRGHDGLHVAHGGMHGGIRQVIAVWEEGEGYGGTPEEDAEEARAKADRC